MKNFKTTLTLTATIFLSGVFIFGFAGDTFAGTGQNVSGWAWSSNIGWIKFNNCTDISNPATCSSINYGVNLDDSGNFSGYAWSSNIGWISFNRSDTDNPPSNDSGSGAIARYDSVTGKISGWARAFSQGGGWDGWIALGDMNTGDAFNYGVAINESGDFTGWAWGSDVVGWISFNCANRGTCGTSDYKVTGPPRPNTPGILPLSWNNCEFEGASIPTFNWAYTHPKGYSQAKYQIRIDANANFPVDAKGDPVLGISEFKCGVSGTEVCAGPASISFVPTTTPWKNWMEWNSQYYWTVRVKDVYGRWSNWSAAQAQPFTTPKHPYPRVTITGNTEAFADTLVEFLYITRELGIPSQVVPQSVPLGQTPEDEEKNEGEMYLPEKQPPKPTCRAVAWSVTPKRLSTNLVHDPDSKKISGTFSEAGTYNIMVSFKDRDCYSCSAIHAITVSSGPGSTPPPSSTSFPSTPPPTNRYKFGE